jgi:hypothetical protein
MKMNGKKTGRNSRRKGKSSAVIAGGGQGYDGDSNYIGRLMSGPLIRPDKMQVRLPYTQNFTLDPTSGYTQTYNFRINSLWDPDYTASSGSGQAMGSGQWAAFYNNYRVLGVDVIVQCAQGASAQVPCEVSFAPAAFYVLGGAGEEYFRRVAEGPRNRRLFLPLGGGSTSTARAYYPMHELFGVTPAQYLAEENFSGLLNSGDPAASMFLSFASYNAAARNTDALFRVHLVFHSELTNPKLPTSTV